MPAKQTETTTQTITLIRCAYTYALALAGAVYPTSQGGHTQGQPDKKTMTSPGYLGNLHQATRPYVYHTVDSQVNCTCQRARA